MNQTGRKFNVDNVDGVSRRHRVFLDLRTGNETVLQEGMVFHLPQTMRVGESTPTAVSGTVLVT